jgi:hypothetical protein
MRDRASLTASRAATLVARAALVAAVALPTLAVSSAHAQFPEWQQRLLREARALTYGAEQVPVPDPSVPRPWPLPGIPDITFAPLNGRSSASGIAGRITSRNAYPHLGIPAGVSYLWVVTQPTVRMAIVPAESGRPGAWLPTSPHTSPGAGAPCASNRFLTQLGIRRPGPGQRMLLAACTCVDGVWMHTEGAGAERLTEAHARLLVTR